MQLFLSALSYATRRFPALVLLGCLVLFGIALTATVRRLQLITDIQALLPRESEIARVTREALRDFGSFDFMFTVVEAREGAGPDDLLNAASEIAHALDDRRFFSSVEYRLDRRAMQLIEGGGLVEADELIVNLLTEADWDAIEQRLEPGATARALQQVRDRLREPLSSGEQEKLLEDPLGLTDIIRRRLTFTSGPAKLHVREGYFLSADGRMLLMILRPVRPSSDLGFAQSLSGFLGATQDGLMERHPEWRKLLRMNFVGSHVETVQNTRMVQHDFMGTLIASFLGILALFYLTFRRLEVLVYIGIPLVFGIVWTLGLTAGLLGRLTIVTAALGGVLVGLGVDYGILLYNRFLEEVRRGREIREAADLILHRAGPGIIVGGFTTMIGFLGMTLVSFRGFQELGLVASMGILCCLTASLLMVPSMMVLFMARRAESIRHRPLLTLGLPQIADMVLSRPRTTLVAGVLLTVYFGWQAAEARFDDDISGLQQPSRRYLELQKRLEERFETPSKQIVAIVEGATLEEALHYNDQLYLNLQSWQQRATEKILAFDSLRTYLPSEKTQRYAQDRMIRLGTDWEQRKAALLEQAAEVGLAPESLAPFFHRVERWIETARRRPYLRFGNLPGDFFETVVQRYVYKSPSGQFRILTQIYPPQGQWRLEIPEAFLDTLQLGIPKIEVTGVVLLASRLKGIVLHDLAWTCLFVVGAVLLILMLHFRGPGDCFLALLPVGVSLIWTLGIWRLMGLDLNFLNILVLPMILGVGVHSGLHLLERYREMGKRRMNLVMETTGRAVLLTALTTMLGFGSLALAQSRGLQEMGLLTLFGVGTNLAAVLIFLPATVRIIERRLTFEDWNPQDLG